MTILVMRVHPLASTIVVLATMALSAWSLA